MEITCPGFAWTREEDPGAGSEAGWGARENRGAPDTRCVRSSGMLVRSSTPVCRVPGEETPLETARSDQYGLETHTWEGDGSVFREGVGRLPSGKLTSSGRWLVSYVSLTWAMQCPEIIMQVPVRVFPDQLRI